MLDEKTRQPGEPTFDAAKHPMMVYNLAGMVVTFIADLDVAQDIYSGKGS